VVQHIGPASNRSPGAASIAALGNAHGIFAQRRNAEQAIKRERRGRESWYLPGSSQDLFSFAYCAGALLNMGWSTDSVLADRLPGTVLLQRGDGRHYFIIIGNRESMYATVAVRYLVDRSQQASFFGYPVDRRLHWAQQKSYKPLTRKSTAWSGLDLC
jgi:hypothetical protein